MTEKENIKIIELDDIRIATEKEGYYLQDVVIAEGVSPGFSDDCIKLSFMIFLLCKENEIVVNINHKDYCIRKDELVILFPGTILKYITGSTGKNCEVQILCFSSDFLNTTLRPKDILNIAYILRGNPILDSRKFDNEKALLYKRLITKQIKGSPTTYTNDTISHIFSALLCEIASILLESFHEDELPSIPEGQSFRIFKQFIEAVSNDNGIHRSVTHFADLLCYSPKHLYTAIKNISGKSPLEIINAQTIKHIEFQLKHSDKSMKELAEYFNFANPSFFGSYVKKHLGMSPQQYRKKYHQS